MAKKRIMTHKVIASSSLARVGRIFPVIETGLLERFQTQSDAAMHIVHNTFKDGVVFKNATSLSEWKFKLSALCGSM